MTKGRNYLVGRWTLTRQVDGAQRTGVRRAPDASASSQRERIWSTTQRSRRGAKGRSVPRRQERPGRYQLRPLLVAHAQQQLVVQSVVADRPWRGALAEIRPGGGSRCMLRARNDPPPAPD